MIKLKEKTLAALCLAASEKYKEKPALAMLSGGKIVKRMTYAQLGSRSQQIGLLLRHLNVQNGCRVLLLSENCPEWAVAYFSIAFANAVSVPLLTGFSAEQIQNIANHAQISAVCLSSAIAEKLHPESLFSPHIPVIYTDSMSNDEITVLQNGVKRQIALQSLKDKEGRLKANQDDLATIIYTSGTQGNSKGVMLSGVNLISSAASSFSFVELRSRDRLLSVLPLAHAYECSLGLLFPLISGSSVTYLDRPPSPSVLLPAVKLLRPTVMISVPLLIEKIYRNAIAPKLHNSRLYKFPITRPLAEYAAGRKLISALGGRIRFFGIGGAPLSEETEAFLHNARFPYAIGYGLTEAAPLVAGSKPYRFPLRYIGKAPKGVAIRIAKCDANGEGEVQVRGPNTMIGYFNDRENSSEAFTSDGWLRTGDLGRFDKKGMLRIMGRIKALILSSSGENIYPEEIESLLGSSQLVEDAIVYSGEKGELIALVCLSDAAKAAAEHALEELKSWVNKKLAAFSRISRIEIRSEPFEKTPTMKIKRYLYI